MRPKSVADERRQLALALELSKREMAAGGRRSSRVGTRILYFALFLLWSSSWGSNPEDTPEVIPKIVRFYSSVVEK